MQATVFKILQALNGIEVKGEKNIDLLLYAMQQLKSIQAQMLADAQSEKGEEETAP